MKVFLVFLALLFINLNFFIYHTDCNRYEKIQSRIKAAAEDCAAGAALYYREEEYGNGIFAIDEDCAKDYMDAQLEETKAELISYLNGDFSGNVKIDDMAVTATIKFEGEDLFRLPFLQKNKIIRTAKYKWEE